MSSDEEPEFRTFNDARNEAKERSKLIGHPISKPKKKKASRPRKNIEKEPMKELPPPISTINPNLLDIINEEVPVAKVKEAVQEISKNENQLEKLRTRGEGKVIKIEKEPKIQRKHVSNFEVVLVKNSYKPKGNPESAAKVEDFKNRIFYRSNVRRLPLTQILKK